jgi:hypothetical protein
MAGFLMSIFLAVLILFILSVKIVIPEMNTKKSAKPFCTKINAIMKPEEKLALLAFIRKLISFIQAKNILRSSRIPDEINHFFNSEERRYLIVKPNELNSIQKWIKVPTHMLLSESVGHRDFVFVSNKMKD